LKDKAALEKEKDAMLKSAEEKAVVMNKKLGSIGNYIHDSVVVDKNEDNNPLIREWCPEGLTVEPGKREGLLSHHEVLLRLDGYAPEAGVKVVGHRGYFLRYEAARHAVTSERTRLMILGNGESF
jgi:seryl-tRNA synthetase